MAQPGAQRIDVQAGPLNLFFENGLIGSIRYGDREVLRRVYVAVRDRNWGTVALQIANLQIRKSEWDFRVTFEATCQEGEIDFRWQGEITGQADGSLTFAMDGEAHTGFWRNRIGFCVLHPITECAGQPCEIEHVDGRRERGVFPKLIAPHQPFKEIRAIRHEIVPGLRAEVRMTGDVFEMEDQRNWTDASYKTYGTPLDTPFPVWVARGDRVQQVVRIRLLGDYESRLETEVLAHAIQVSLLPNDPYRMPELGLGRASHGQPLSKLEIERLGALNLNHLRTDLWMGGDTWQADLVGANNEASEVGCGLEIALHVSDEAETELLALVPVLKEIQTRIVRWIIFHTNETSTDLKWVVLARRILSGYDPQAPTGCGSDSNFAEFNRRQAVLPSERRSQPPPDFFCYAANPQVHAGDNLTLVENLAGLGETVISARRLANGKGMIVSPVTLRPRFNVVATSEEAEVDASELPPTVDPRQMSLFGADWTLGAIKTLAENGVDSATFYETSGWRGVMETEGGSPLPQQFPSIPGAVYPLYHVLAAVGEFAGGQVVPSISSDPHQVEVLALRKGYHTRVLVANFSGKPSPIQVVKLPKRVRVVSLDESNLVAAMQSPEKYRQQPGEVLKTESGSLTFEMKPYAILRIEYNVT